MKKNVKMDVKNIREFWISIEIWKWKQWLFHQNKFLKTVECYIRPFSPNFHKQAGVPIKDGEEKFYFSIVPFDDKRYK